MKFDMKSPCPTCPFRRGTSMKLRRGRIVELSELMSSPSGGSFSCHKTVDYSDYDDGDVYVAGPSDKHCAGALIYAEKQENATQVMRVAERFGAYDAAALMTEENVAAVWDGLDEWLEGGAFKT